MFRIYFLIDNNTSMCDFCCWKNVDIVRALVKKEVGKFRANLVLRVVVM